MSRGLLIPEKYLWKPPLGARIDPLHPLSAGLQGAWLFNEGGGNVFYNPANPLFNATLTTGGATATTRVPTPYGPGVSHTASASNNGATFTSLSAGTTFTFATWVNLTSVSSAYQNLLTNSSTSGIWTKSGKLDAFLNQDKLSTTAVSAGVWVNWVFSCSAASGTFYLNGVADGTASSVTAFSPTGMLCDPGGTEQFTGTMSHQYLWVGRALTAAEVQGLYVNPFAMFNTAVL